MPGIAGIISQRPASECESLVQLMIGSMLYEPFYVCGMYGAPELGICAGWVAQENSFAAHQVFRSGDGEVALLFAGECFPDSETEALLRRRGHSADRDGGAWLVHLYLELGDAFFAQLNGLFSGLLVDKRKGVAFLFNDRYGIERIYWHEDKDTFYFASEAKALLRILPELRSFDREGVSEFLAFGCTLGSRTLFRDVRSLPPASCWRFEGDGREEQKYFSFENWESQSIGSEQDFEAEFEETFKRVLPRYLRSGSSLGISLTAGLDGRMIMACLPEFAEKPVCYTFCGQERDTLDARLAARVAAACGLEYQTLRIGQDFFENFASYADRTVYVSDGCLGVTGTHEIYMNERARRLAAVRLTGVFGGEVLREVSFSKALGLNVNLLNREWTGVANASEAEFLGGDQHPVTSAVTREIPQKRYGVVATGRSQTIFRTPYLDNELVALAYRTPSGLRGSPQPGFALIQRNSEPLGRIPTDMGWVGNGNGLDRVARRVFSRITFKLDYFSQEGLPPRLSSFDPLLRTLNSSAGILGLHKFLHYPTWFRREVGNYVKERLRAAAGEQTGLWNARFLKEMTCAHLAGKANYTKEINAVLTLGAVDRTLLQHTTRSIVHTDGGERRTASMLG